MAWGDGRQTTKAKVIEYCERSGLSELLKDFIEDAKSGIVRLFAAFFFRRHESLPGEDTFVFTHKSFGEYLTALRIVRAVKLGVRDLLRKKENLDDGKSKKDILIDWVKICGPSPMTSYLLDFVRREIKLNKAEAPKWQKGLESLFSYIMKARLPMELVQTKSFKEAQYYSRNAEESLFAVLNACALVTKKFVKIDFPTKYAFGSWLKRIQGQITEPETPITSDCISYMDLTKSPDLFHIDLFRANLYGANLHEVNLHGANLYGANLNE
ncbi:pentapeptide repeat-containing protein, partial [bacterium]|nr:pentapeptide repeat-containing protein [bacterium]